MRTLLYFIFLLFLVTSAQAHQTGLSYIVIKEDAQHNIDVVYKKPLSDTKSKDIKIRYPLKCSKVSQDSMIIENGFIINKYKLWCTKDGLSQSRIWIDGLMYKDRGVMIRYEKGNNVSKALIRAQTPFMRIDHTKDNFNLFLEYVNLGLFHIWSGYDHLLFVFSLLLLSPKLKKIFLAITAFTLSHSITLAFGVLGIVSIGVGYIESMIALSIIFLARELVTNEDSLTKRHIEIVAFIFGLLHGFGFSTALKNIGLPQNEIPLSLFSFNLGIEIGQVAFILLMSLILYIFRSLFLSKELLLKKILAYAIGTISSYWFIQRVVGF